MSFIKTIFCFFYGSDRTLSNIYLSRMQKHIFIFFFFINSSWHLQCSLFISCVFSRKYFLHYEKYFVKVHSKGNFFVNYEEFYAKYDCSQHKILFLFEKKKYFLSFFINLMSVALVYWKSHSFTKYAFCSKILFKSLGCCCNFRSLND